MQSSGSPESWHTERGAELTHRRIASLLELVANARADQRAAVLDQLDIDTETRTEIESLLAHEGDAEQLSQISSLLRPVPEEFSDEAISSAITIPGFRLGRVIGQGATGIVYKARQENPDRDVAIKVLRLACSSSEGVDRLRLEAHLVARLEHRGIGRIYHAGLIETPLMALPYIVMEYVDGEPLSEAIESCDLSHEDRLAIVLDLCAAIGYSHGRGVVHRDIKPSNVMVTRDDSEKSLSAKIIDFGIAKLIDGSATPVSVETLDASTMGTLRYMSPERRTGRDSGATVASDIYSLGLLACETLSGVRLVSGTSTNAPEAVGLGKAELAPFSEPIRQVLSRMTAYEPAKRYSSALEASEALQRAAHAGLAKSRGFRIRHRVTRVLLSGAAVLLVCAGIANVVAESTQSRSRHDGILVAESKLRQQPLALVTAKPNELWPIKERVRFARARLEIANRHADAGRRDEAQRTFETLAEKTQDPPEFGPGALNAAEAYIAMRAGSLTKAAALYREAREHLTLDDAATPWTWKRWFKVAHGLQQCGAPEEAREMYTSGLAHPLFNSQPWHVRTAAFQFFGGVLWLEQDYEGAESYLRRSLHDAPRARDPRAHLLLASRESSLGVVLRAQGKLEEAQGYQERAVERVISGTESDHPEVCRLSQNLAITYLLAGRFTEAEELAFHARAVWAESPNHWAARLAEADLILGSVALETGSLVIAESWLLQAQRLCSSLDPAVAERLDPLIQNALGDLALRSGSLETGIRLLNTSEELLVQRYGVAHPWSLLGAERRERSQSTLP